MIGFGPTRESGVETLGPIPAHWLVERNKTIFREVNERSRGGEELLTVSHLTGVTTRAEKQNVTMFLAETTESCKRCQPMDLAINTMWAWMGALGIVPTPGIVSPSYNVYRFRRPGLHEPRYFDHLYRSAPYVAEINRYSKGVWTSRLRLYPESFLQMPVLLPPKREQQAIARFLDRKTAAIDALIAKKERLVELLTERRDIAISKAIREAQGTEVRLGYLVDMLPGFAFPSDGFQHGELGVRLLRGINVGVGEVRWEDTVRWDGTDGLSAYALQEGDLVLGMDRPWISGGARIATVQKRDLPALLLQRVLRIRSGRRIRQRYLHLVLASREFREYFEPELTGVSVPHISHQQVATFRIRLPSVDEQDRITHDVERVVVETRRAAGILGRQVESLKEFRQAVITAAVTGKIDVSKEAA